MEELEKVPKELKGSATVYVEQQYGLLFRENGDFHGRVLARIGGL